MSGRRESRLCSSITNIVLVLGEVRVNQDGVDHHLDLPALLARSVPVTQHHTPDSPAQRRDHITGQNNQVYVQ